MEQLGIEATKGSLNLDNGIPPRIATCFLIFFLCKTCDVTRLPSLVAGGPSDL